MRKVYNGYKEMFLTGLEIKEFLKDAHETFGKHHEKISSKKINFKYYPKIKDGIKYRIFYNNNFFKIMKNDKNIYFISYIKGCYNGE